MYTKRSTTIGVYDAICLGVCIPRDGLGAVYDGICEITAWCPVEIDRKFIKSVNIKIAINIWDNFCIFKGNISKNIFNIFDVI